jgi:hypothetical protein
MSRNRFIHSLGATIVTLANTAEGWETFAARVIRDEAFRADISPDDITGNSRASRFYRPRRAAAKIMADAGMTQAQIGRALFRDKTSIYSMLRDLRDDGKYTLQQSRQGAIVRTGNANRRTT